MERGITAIFNEPGMQQQMVIWDNYAAALSFIINCAFVCTQTCFLEGNYSFFKWVLECIMLNLKNLLFEAASPHVYNRKCPQ